MISSAAARILSIALLACLALPTAGLAEGRQLLGYGRLVNNDFIGDGFDRWHTGGLSSSRVRGYGWDGDLPRQIGDILEYRIAGGIISPRYMTNPTPGDRPYAGWLSFGLHSHFARGGAEFSLGADLVVTGPQTRLGEVQTFLHDTFFGVPPSPEVLDDQIANGFHPTLVGEMGYPLILGDRTRLRPFVEARWGAETLARIGADLTIGRVGRGELLVREVTTGQRYRTIQEPVEGTAFVLGGDIAKVRDSVFLPASRGLELTPTRNRVRAGVHWQGRQSSVFYGITWLGKEHETQTGAQTLGSIRLNLKF